MAGALEGDVFIGPQAQQYRGLFKINYPLEHGIVTDWDDMERIWQYVYTEELKTVSEDVCQDLMPQSSECLLESRNETMANAEAITFNSILFSLRNRH